MEIVIQGMLLLLGFVMLIKGADWFVEGASGIADRFGIPQLVIGLTIVAFGTSAPECMIIRHMCQGFRQFVCFWVKVVCFLAIN